MISFSNFSISNGTSKNSNFLLLVKFTCLSYHFFSFFKNCLIGKASKNSLAIKMQGRLFNSFRLFNHLIFLLLILVFCVFWSNLLFSNILILQDFLNIGNLLNVRTNILIISPFPAPNSIKLNCLGRSSFSQNEINQIAIISENNIDMFGAVIKSPLLPKGFFFM